MTNNKRWKSKLNSSSLPLEFEAAKILVAKNFSVTSDYSYSRDDAGLFKDFSVDIEAMGYTPFNNPNKLTSAVHLLVECKYRLPDTKWLFLPDPNKSEYSPIILGTTLRLVSTFSPYYISLGSTVQFDENMNFAYKGTEIKINEGDVYNTEIRHGILQLQYALPRLFTDLVKFNGGLGEDCIPFFFCAILLTNADLYLANQNLTIKDVENATELVGISNKVPYLVLYQEFGPDFEKHCSKECEYLGKLEKLDYMNELAQVRNAYKKGGIEDLFVLSKGLANSETYYLKSYFTQFVVCNFTAFPKLINQIKTISKKAAATRKILY